MRSIEFTVYGVPMPAGSKKGFYNAKTKRVIITDASDKSRPWKALVHDAAGQAMRAPEANPYGFQDPAGYLPPLEGPLTLEVTFVLPRPKGHFGKHGLRPSAPTYPAVRPDTTKLLRGVEDAMQSVCYDDDAQIVEQVIRKVYGDVPRCEVRVSEIANEDTLTTERTPA